MLRTDELDYDLPPEAIATRPASPRDSARLMVVRGARDPEHARVCDLAELLRAGDVLVFNRSRVLPARFEGVRADTGGRVEGLYLRDGREAGTWEVMLKARRFKVGMRVRLDHAELELIARADADEPGAWVVRTHGGAVEVLARAGLTPLPPYIRSARVRRGESVPDADDRAWYQTVYAREAGSVAAPTAGLHFTPALLEALDAAGIGRATVVLHVGSGTFKGVETPTVDEHPMHAERCAMDDACRATIEAARQRGGRVFAVGTTSARTLESLWERDTREAETRLLITPGYRWRVVDGLLTNFHLPRSTLMAMVGALLPGGVARLRALYGQAIGAGYRFYSYGDAMLVMPGETHGEHGS
ncbi:MAG: tRNA preQ1(34) S-adenosylmethionine ribosyltransferase-isomerase QueA [Phycisphaerales bacterium]|nr:tRNA preQ1(34) S-adenosylmethionine ribosyltransferase-isomerase QueA [Phycisphaerales bacterium]